MKKTKAELIAALEADEVKTQERKRREKEEFMGDVVRKKNASTSNGNNGSKWCRKDLRLAILMRDHLACVYCLVDLTTIDPRDVTLDHVSGGHEPGNNGPGNLVSACRSCNSRKGSRTLAEFASADVQARVLEALLRPVPRDLAKGLIAGTLPEIDAPFGTREHAAQLGEADAATWMREEPVSEWRTAIAPGQLDADASLIDALGAKTAAESVGGTSFKDATDRGLFAAYARGWRGAVLKALARQSPVRVTRSVCSCSVPVPGCPKCNPVSEVVHLMDTGGSWSACGVQPPAPVLMDDRQVTCPACLSLLVSGGRTVTS